MTYADAFNLRTTNVKFNDVADAIDGSFGREWGGTSTGSTNAYAITPSPAVSALSAGDCFSFIPNFTNTGASTITVGSASSVSFRYLNNACVGGEIVSGRLCRFVFDGTYAVILNHGGGWATWTPTGSGAFPSSLTVTLAQYQRKGGRVDFRFELQATTTSTTTICGFTLPITATSTSSGFDASHFAGGVSGGFGLYSSTTVAHVYKSDATNFATGTVTVIRGSGFYSV